jgi:hypothetical protein
MSRRRRIGSPRMPLPASRGSSTAPSASGYQMQRHNSVGSWLLSAEVCAAKGSCTYFGGRNSCEGVNGSLLGTRYACQPRGQFCKHDWTNSVACNGDFFSVRGSRQAPAQNFVCTCQNVRIELEKEIGWMLVVPCPSHPTRDT